jgi:hypothetical protein
MRAIDLAARHASGAARERPEGIGTYALETDASAFAA